VPSIEIACIGLHAPVEVSAATIAVRAEPQMKSHRVPSRFQGDFDALEGSLYHLGNPNLRAPKPGARFYAYELLSEASRAPFPPSSLQFASEHIDEVRRVLSELLDASPRGQILFTSDWEYGPEWAYRFGPVTLEEFWSLHQARMLYLNAAYTIVAGPDSKKQSSQ
jgi:hypothetical protein